MDPSGLTLTASSAATYFYIVGGVLVVLALVISFVGMRREDFPSTGALRGILGLVTLTVVLVCTGAVVLARDEQETRRAENAEAAKEAEAETEANEEATATEGEGEAAEPEAAPEPGGGEAVDGAALFVDTGCGSCHVLADAGSDGAIGPSLDEVLPGQDEEMIRTSIVDPAAETAEGFSAGVMPANYGDTLSAEELDALVGYLAGAAGN